MPIQLGAASLVLVAAMIGIDAAQAADVKVMAANAVKEPFLELVAAFEKSSGHKVTAVWSGTAGVTNIIGDAP